MTRKQTSETHQRQELVGPVAHAIRFLRDNHASALNPPAPAPILHRLGEKDAGDVAVEAELLEQELMLRITNESAAARLFRVAHSQQDGVLRGSTGESAFFSEHFHVFGSVSLGTDSLISATCGVQCGSWVQTSGETPSIWYGPLHRDRKLGLPWQNLEASDNGGGNIGLHLQAPDPYWNATLISAGDSKVVVVDTKGSGAPAREDVNRLIGHACLSAWLPRRRPMAAWP